MDKFIEDKLPLEDPPLYEDIVGSGDNDTTTDANPSASATTQEQQRKRRLHLSKVLLVLGVMCSTYTLFMCFQTWRQNITTRPALPNMPNRLEGRKQWVNTGSKSVNADYNLLDFLSIRSEAGALNVRVHPQPADEANKPAELFIYSRSGALTVDTRARDPPERDYYTTIDSFSGFLKGDILHGRKTAVSSFSSSLDVEFVLYALGNYSSELSTTSASGSQKIYVTSSLDSERESITGLKSVHTAESGSMSLRYPEKWEGTIEGYTKSGRISVKGKDVEIIQEKAYPPAGRYVLARKGKGNSNSTLNFHTGSGSVDLYVG